MRGEDGVPRVNSRDVAERFDKQHQHVLRDIERTRLGVRERSVYVMLAEPACEPQKIRRPSYPTGVPSLCSFEVL